MLTITSYTRRQLTELRKELKNANESCKYKKDLQDIQVSCFLALLCPSWSAGSLVS